MHYFTIEQRETLQHRLEARAALLREEIGDGVSAGLNAEPEAAALELDVAELRAVEAALTRVHTPEFGLCGDAGREFPMHASAPIRPRPAASPARRSANGRQTSCPRLLVPAQLAVNPGAIHDLTCMPFVWMDHQEARVLHFTRDKAEKELVMRTPAPQDAPPQGRDRRRQNTRSTGNTSTGRRLFGRRNGNTYRGAGAVRARLPATCIRTRAILPARCWQSRQRTIRATASF